MDNFVWTKYGWDSGEGESLILKRKECERVQGEFWWGIGSSIDSEKLKTAVAQNGGHLPVVFSRQQSKIKSVGDGMAIWRQFLRDGSISDVPGHVLITSQPKAKKFYALVCESEDSLEMQRRLDFNQTLCRNFRSGRKLGNSQNTALLSGPLTHSRHCERGYKYGFTAKLKAPFLVRLTKPEILSEEKVTAIRNWNGKDYARLVAKVSS